MRSTPRAGIRRFLTAATMLAAVGLAAVVAPIAGRVAPAAAANCSLTKTLKQGAKSAEVTCLETRLIELGYTLTGPDTSFGSSTTKAVKAYQQANGLAVDGIVGPITRGSLGLNAPLPTPPALVDPVPAKVTETRVIGQSVQGRDITAYRMGTPGGRVVLVIGVIHGDEQKGGEVTKLLRTMATPKGIDLWLIDTINPDGVAANTRGNANAVDLNRNFEAGWSYIPKSTEHRQYSGENPADQPETIAVQAFVREIAPTVTVWYHQDANTITINGDRKVIPRTYGTYVGLAPGNVPCSQRCTGTASTFVNSTVDDSTSFLVELPGSAKVTSAMIRQHATALLAVITL